MFKWRLGGVYKDNSSIKLEDIKKVLITCDQGLESILFSRFLKLLWILKPMYFSCNGSNGRFNEMYNSELK